VTEVYKFDFKESKKCDRHVRKFAKYCSGGNALIPLCIRR
jgi:hypothetical protein